MAFSVGRMPNSPLGQYMFEGLSKGLQTRAAKQEAILGRQHQKTMQDDRQNAATEAATDSFNRKNLLQQLDYHQKYGTDVFQGEDPVTGLPIDKTSYGFSGDGGANISA